MGHQVIEGKAIIKRHQTFILLAVIVEWMFATVGSQGIIAGAHGRLQGQNSIVYSTLRNHSRLHMTIPSRNYALLRTLKSPPAVRPLRLDTTQNSRTSRVSEQNGGTRQSKDDATNNRSAEERKQLKIRKNQLEYQKLEEISKPPNERNDALILTTTNQINDLEGQLNSTPEDEIIEEYYRLSGVDEFLMKRIRDQLSEDRILVSYIVRADKLQAFIITKHSLLTVPLPVSEEELNEAIHSFRDSFANLNKIPTEILKSLYGWLIKPIEKYLEPSVIGIIPDGALHYLPFAALTRDGQSYFGDLHSLFYLPKASWILFIGNKHEVGKPKALVMAQSYVKYRPFLRFADKEAEEIAKLYGTQAITEGKATESFFRQHVSEYNVVHLAVHGEYNENTPRASRIFLAADQDANEDMDLEHDGILDVDEIKELSLKNTDLVILSACETKPGGKQNGAGIFSLSDAFITAKASSVIASLWQVDDESTKLLMGLFHAYFLQGKNKADALREAQRETRRQYHHPFSWAAFILTGDPGGIDATRSRRTRGL